MGTTRLRGSAFEALAEAFLERRGLRPLQRNFQARFGEIDLVMLDGEELVFVEVRYRAGCAFGSPADSVTPAKQRRLVSTAGLFLGRHPRHGRRPCRFDVVSITGKGRRPVIEWIRDAFDAGG